MKDDKKNFRFYWEESHNEHPEKENQTSVPSFKIEMPGFSKDEITAKLTNNMITVTAAKKAHEVKKGKTFYHEEASSASFSKSMTLPHEIDSGNFEVVIVDGAVTLKRKKKKLAEKA